MNPFIVTTLCILALQPIGCTPMKYDCQNFEIPKEDLIVDAILEKSAIFLEKKYKMHPMGTNVAMPSGIVNLLGLHFQTQRTLTKEEARKILVDSAQYLLNSINNNQEIRPYLKVYPFTLDNVDITIFINNSAGYPVEDSGIGIASIRDGKLEYNILSTVDNIPVFKNTSIESYEDALKITQQIGH